MHATADGMIRSITRGIRLNVAGFIVSIYGEGVVLRGGVQWTGTLIAMGAEVGGNGSLVRTAVSRLVMAAELAEERIGRRSYCRLRSLAVATLMQAADLVSGPDRPARCWQILHDPELRPEEARQLRMGIRGAASISALIGGWRRGQGRRCFRPSR